MHDQFRIDHRRVADQTDRKRGLFFFGFFHQRHRFFQRIDDGVHITHVFASLRVVRINFDDQPDSFVHGDSQRLRASHPAQASSQDEFAS